MEGEMNTYTTDDSVASTLFVSMSLICSKLQTAPIEDHSRESLQGEEYEDGKMVRLEWLLQLANT